MAVILQKCFPSAFSLLEERANKKNPHALCDVVLADNIVSSLNISLQLGISPNGIFASPIVTCSFMIFMTKALQTIFPYRFLVEKTIETQKATTNIPPVAGSSLKNVLYSSEHRVNKHCSSGGWIRNKCHCWWHKDDDFCKQMEDLAGNYTYFPEHQARHADKTTHGNMGDAEWRHSPHIIAFQCLSGNFKFYRT